MKTAFVIALSLAGLLITTGIQAAKVYTWVDADGVTHYSERPPKNVKASAVELKTGHSEPVNYGGAAETTTAESAPAAAQAQPQAQTSRKNPERCEQARKNLEVLQNFGRVRVQNEDGTFRYLTEEDQRTRLEETQKIIDEAC